MLVVRSGDVLFPLQLFPNLSVFPFDLPGLAFQLDRLTAKVFQRGFANLLLDTEPFAQDGVIFQLLHCRFNQALPVFCQYLFVFFDPFLEAAYNPGDSADDTRRTSDDVTAHDAADPAGHIADAAHQLGDSGKGTAQSLVKEFGSVSSHRDTISHFIALLGQEACLVGIRKSVPLVDQKDYSLASLLDRSVKLLVDLLLHLVKVACVELAERLFQHVAVVKLYIDLDSFE